MAKKEMKKSVLWSWVKDIFWAVVIALFIRTFFVQAFKIPSGSMEETLLVGDFLLATKFFYGTKIPFTDKVILPGFRQPRRGDIIVFRYPLDKRDFIKRCIAVEDDTVEIKNKQVYINGNLLNESYTVHKSPEIIEIPEPIKAELSQVNYQKIWEQRKFLSEQVIRDNFGPVVVPKDCLFMMGDNRDNSSDSRFWGPLPKKFIKGKALILYMSWDSESWDPFYILWKKIRWKRIGMLIK
ncbi:MAG: signal peptidase I [Candidatus Edwardsbacteria bacterium]